MAKSYRHLSNYYDNERFSDFKLIRESSDECIHLHKNIISIIPYFDKYMENAKNMSYNENEYIVSKEDEWEIILMCIQMCYGVCKASDIPLEYIVQIYVLLDKYCWNDAKEEIILRINSEPTGYEISVNSNIEELKQKITPFVFDPWSITKMNLLKHMFYKTLKQTDSWQIDKNDTNLLYQRNMIRELFPHTKLSSEINEQKYCDVTSLLDIINKHINKACKKTKLCLGPIYLVCEYNSKSYFYLIDKKIIKIKSIYKKIEWVGSHRFKLLNWVSRINNIHYNKDYNQLIVNMNSYDVHGYLQESQTSFVIYNYDEW